MYQSFNSLEKTRRAREQNEGKIRRGNRLNPRVAIEPLIMDVKGRSLRPGRCLDFNLYLSILADTIRSFNSQDNVTAFEGCLLTEALYREDSVKTPKQCKTPENADQECEVIQTDPALVL